MDSDFSMYQDMLQNPNSEKDVVARFYDRPVKTDKIVKNLPVFEDVCFCEIRIKNNNSEVVDQPATEEKKRRFAVEYSRYLLSKKQVESGTKLEMYAFLQASQVESCKLRGIFTVEALAALKDEQAQELGIFAEKELAAQFLKSSENNGAISEIAALKDGFAAKEAAHAEELAKLKDEFAAKEQASAQEIANLKDELKKLKKD